MQEAAEDTAHSATVVLPLRSDHDLGRTPAGCAGLGPVGPTMVTCPRITAAAVRRCQARGSVLEPVGLARGLGATSQEDRVGAGQAR